jgi:hypothetical protein
MDRLIVALDGDSGIGLSGSSDASAHVFEGAHCRDLHTRQLEQPPRQLEPQSQRIDQHSQPPDPLKVRFGAIDKNKDKYIDVPEMQDALEKKLLSNARSNGYATAKSWFKALYKIAHPGTTESDINKMQLKESETNGLEGLIRYRSEIAQGAGFYNFLHDKDEHDESSQPVLAFKDIAHHTACDGTESVLTFDDLVVAYNGKLHAQARDFGRRKVDPNRKGAKMSFAQFKQFYNENPIVR